MKAFILGSCRVWKSAYYLKWASEDSTIQSHYADEILQYLKWLLGKKVLNDEEKLCFRHDMTDDIWQTLRKKFNESDTIFIEVSSIKTVYNKQNYINLLRKNNIPVVVDKNIVNKIIQINRLIPNNKKCVFFPHANMYSKRVHGFIKNRLIIQDNFRLALNKENFLYLDPAEIINKYGCDKCMKKMPSGEYDINHYTEFMIVMIATYMSEICK
jgi:hypothetical protein